MNSKLYTSYIRNQPCLIKQDNFRVDAHHTGGTTNRFTGLAKRNFDFAQVPLQHDLHMQLHEIGESIFWKTFNVSPTKAVINLMSNFCVQSKIFIPYNLIEKKKLALDERKDFVEEFGEYIYEILQDEEDS